MPLPDAPTLQAAVRTEATGMREMASKLEAHAANVTGLPIALEAYSECIAILRDAADRLTRP